MKTAVIVHPRGMESFVAELSGAFLVRGVASRTTTWADLSVPSLAGQAGDVALVVCYGPRPEDTDVDAWWVAKSAGVRVLPVELEGTRSPAIYADVHSARFAAGADWSRSLEALVRALA